MENEQSQPLEQPAQQGQQPEAPKELSPEEVALRDKQRQIFRNLHDFFGETGIAEAEGNLGALEGLLNAKFMETAEKVKVEELGIVPDDEITKSALNILKENTVQDAITYCRALNNAMSHFKHKKTKEWTVKSLEIELL